MIFIRARALGTMLSILLLLTASMTPRNARATEAGDQCSQSLLPSEYHQYQSAPLALAETYTLKDLFKQGPDNMIAKHPSIIMGAYQRVYSWMKVMPIERAIDPNLGGVMSNYYPLLSSPNEYNNGRYIVWQRPAVKVFMDYLEAGSRGDRAVKVPIFVGPAGTGKTAFLDVVTAVGNNLTSKMEDYYMYTFEYVNLKDIPSLAPALLIHETADGKTYEQPYALPTYESPYVILPEAYQKYAVDLGRKKAIELTGHEPRPFKYGLPPTIKIRDEILAYYKEHDPAAKANPALVNSPDWQLEMLNKHVRVKRHVHAANGNEPKIDAQGKDVDYDGLFFSKDAFLYAIYGQNHPLSYRYSGKALSGHGAMLVLDEFARNDQALRDVFLGIMESRKVVRGGAFSVPIDAVIIGASNDESITDMMSKGTSKAQLDRMVTVPMRLDTNPVAIAETMLMMRGMGPIQQRKVGLPDEQESWSPAQISDLFVTPKQRGNRSKGPDHRYSIRIQMGPGQEPVYVAPYTLMFISQVTAASRMKVNQGEAANLLNDKPTQVIASSVFSQAVERIKALMGEIPLSGPKEMELAQLSRLLREGTSGISQRDAADIWLASAVQAAQLPENHNTVSIQLVRDVFIRLLEQGEFKFNNNQTRLYWLHLMDALTEELVIPKVNEDVMLAIGGGSAVREIYDQVYNEILALNESDNTATHYTTPSGSQRAINEKRLEQIQQKYLEIHKRELPFQEITDFNSRYGSTQTAESERVHDGLWAAVQSFVADASMSTIPLDDIVNENSTSSEARAKRGEVIDFLVRERGYNEPAARMAIRLLQETLNRTKQVRRR